MGKSIVTPNHVYTKLGNGIIRDLTLDTNTIYTHPSTKQCNYSYTHPTTRQCSRSGDAITDVRTYTISRNTEVSINPGCYILAASINNVAKYDDLEVLIQGNSDDGATPIACGHGSGGNKAAAILSITDRTPFILTIIAQNSSSKENIASKYALSSNTPTFTFSVSGGYSGNSATVKLMRLI